MSQAVAQTKTNSNLPAIFAQLFGDPVNSDLAAGLGSGGFPVIHIKGKVWSVTRSGERENFVDENGDPRPSIEVVIVKAAPHLSKTWYAKKFTDGEEAGAPDCYSNDGKTPAADSKSVQCKTCAACKHNQFGSAVSTDGTGGKGKACQDVKRLAVVPSDLTGDPMLIRIPPGSLKNLREFAKSLSDRGVPYQAVRVRLGFDIESASPKLTFRPVGLLSDEEALKLSEIMQQEIIPQITGEVVAPVNTNEFEEGPTGEDEDNSAAPVEEPVKQPEKEPKPKTTRQTKPAETRVEEKPAETKPAETPVVSSTDDLESFLSGLGV